MMPAHHDDKSGGVLGAALFIGATLGSVFDAAAAAVFRELAPHSRLPAACLYEY